MPRNRQRASAKRISNIDMTPLIDLTFLLLIAFIITYPTLEQGISVKLPRASAAKLDDSKSIALSITQDGTIYLDKAPLTIDELEPALASAVREDPNVALLLRGDEELPYGRMVEVLRVAKRTNIARMALVTEAE